MFKLITATVIVFSSIQGYAQGKTLTPANLYQSIVSATYYHDYYEGRRMANGVKFSQAKMTAAHAFIPLGKKLIVTNLYNNRKVEVTVTDRCACSGVDLSKKAFSKLVGDSSWAKVGRINVRIEYNP